MRARGPTRRFFMKVGPSRPLLSAARWSARLPGILHIVRGDDSIDPVNAEYRIAFAPEGCRHRARHVMVDGLDQLPAFLRRAHIPTPEIERA